MSRNLWMKRLHRVLVLGLCDAFVITFSLWMALGFRSSSLSAWIKRSASNFLIYYRYDVLALVLITLLVSAVAKTYGVSWRYAKIVDYIKTAMVLAISYAGTFLLTKIYINPLHVVENVPHLTHMDFMLSFFFAIAGSIIVRILLSEIKDAYLRDGTFKNISKKRVMIIGMGATGTALVNSMLKNHTARPVVGIDDAYDMQGLRVSNVPIVGGREAIVDAAQRYKVKEIIIAIPTADKENLYELLEICSQTGCKIGSVPSLHELLNGEANVGQINDVDVVQLLGRKELLINGDDIFGYIQDEVVLVTGGGGSIGSELCRQIAKYSPKRLIIFDIYENTTYDIQNELLRENAANLNLTVLIGSVRDKKRLEEVFAQYRPTVVFHAAAHKHVPLMEDSPNEAIKNNVYGTYNVAVCAKKYKAKRFVLISTDKAVNPVNIMGASKRIAEIIVQRIALTTENTIFAAVRFGNVLGSNGSVIPLFKKQIKEGGPVTVTHPEITRFFMTIPEAVQLVMQAGAMATGGEIFILDMGKPVKIADLAKNLIRLSGFVPGTDIKIQYTGLRPGEKLYEELLLDTQKQTATKHNKIYIEKPIENEKDLMEEIDLLETRIRCECEIYEEMKDWLKREVFNTSEEMIVG